MIPVSRTPTPTTTSTSEVSTLTIATVNINKGFYTSQGAPPKHMQISDFLLKNPVDILALQETALSPDLANTNPFVGYSIKHLNHSQEELEQLYFEKKSRKVRSTLNRNERDAQQSLIRLEAKSKAKRSKGLATLVREEIPISANFGFGNKRTIKTRFTTRDLQCVTVYNVYAEQRTDPKQDTTFNTLLQDITIERQNSFVIIVGDLNATFDTEDRVFSVAPSKSEQTLKQLRDSHLADAFRVANGKRRAYTHPASAPSNRIDHILIDKRLKRHVIHCDIINSGIHTDHLMVLLTLRTDIVLPGWASLTSHPVATRIECPPKLNVPPSPEDKLWDDFREAFKESDTPESMQELMQSCRAAAEKTLGRRTKRAAARDGPRVSRQKRKRNKIADSINAFFKLTSPREGPLDKHGALNTLTKGERAANKMLREEQRPEISPFSMSLEPADRTRWLHDMTKARKIASRGLCAAEAQSKAEKWERWLEDLLEKLIQDPYRLYKKLKGSNDPPKEKIIYSTVNRGTHLEYAFDPQGIIRHKVEYFNELYKTRGDAGRHCFQLPIPDIAAECTLPPIDMEELTNGILNLPKKKAAGPNEVFNEFLQNLPERETNFLLEHFNQILNREQPIPARWKEAMIYMLFKGGEAKSPDNYRGIALLNVDYKLFTVFVKSRLLSFVEKNKIISPSQYGGRPNKSTFNAIQTLKNVIEDAKANSREIHITYIDFRKAFDSIEHWAIEETLQAYSVHSTLIAVIRDIYENNVSGIYTEVGESPVDAIKQERGVKQGCVLSPLLFVLVINPLLVALEQAGCGYRMTRSNVTVPSLGFIDDLAIISETREGMDCAITILDNFLNRNNLEANPSKCAYTTTSTTVRELRVQGQFIPTLRPGDNYKYLGTLINVKGDTTTAIQEAVKKYEKHQKAIDKMYISGHHRSRYINEVANAQIAYQMYTTIFPEETLAKLDATNRKLIKRGARAHSNAANAPIHSVNGFGLESLVDLQIKTQAQTLVEWGLNGSDDFARNTTTARLNLTQLPELDTLKEKLAPLDIRVITKTFDPVRGLLPAKLFKKWKNKNFDGPLHLEYISEDGQVKSLTKLRDEGWTITPTTFYETKDWLQEPQEKLEHQTRKARLLANLEETRDPALSSQIHTINTGRYSLLAHLKPQNQPPTRLTFAPPPHAPFVDPEGMQYVFTDGSVKGPTAGVGICWDPTTQATSSLRCPGNQTIGRAEAAAIFHVLSHNLQDVTIVSDSLSTLQTILKVWKEPSPKWYKIENRDILQGILKAIRARLAQGKRTLFSHITSHLADKVNSPNEKVRNNALKRIEEQKNNLGDVYPIALQGNELADEAAEKGREADQVVLIPLEFWDAVTISLGGIPQHSKLRPLIKSKQITRHKWTSPLQPPETDIRLSRLRNMDIRGHTIDRLSILRMGAIPTEKKMERIAQSAAAKIRKNRSLPSEKDLSFMDKFSGQEGLCQVCQNRGVTATDNAKHRLLECRQAQANLKKLQDHVDDLLQEEGFTPDLNPLTPIEDDPEAQISLLAGFCPRNLPAQVLKALKEKQQSAPESEEAYPKKTKKRIVRKIMKTIVEYTESTLTCYEKTRNWIYLKASAGKPPGYTAPDLRIGQIGLWLGGEPEEPAPRARPRPRPAPPHPPLEAPSAPVPSRIARITEFFAPRTPQSH